MRSLGMLALAAGYVREDRSLLETTLEESGRHTPSRRHADLLEGRLTLFAQNPRKHPFSYSFEDGVGGFLRARVRADASVPDAHSGLQGSDRSFRELTGRLRLYQTLGGPGFAEHVLALRLSGGAAAGPGADESHFELGGASSFSLAFPFDAQTHGLFPVRGYPNELRRGRYAWSGTAAYRFPLGLPDRGLGLVPLYLNRVSGSVFLDGGNAWGPEDGIPGFQNPRRDPVFSSGIEVQLIAQLFWAPPLSVRAGVALPFEQEFGTSFYLRVGRSF